MGWCTNLVCNIEFNKETYNHKWEVEEALERSESLIKTAKEHLSNLAYMTEPNKFCDKGEDPMYFIKNTLEEWLEILEEETISSYKLNLLLRNWDNCHNEKGLAIEAPESFDWKSAWLDGDFVFTDKHPTQESLLGYEIDKEGNIVDDSNAIVDKDGKFKEIKPITLEDLNKENEIN